MTISTDGSTDTFSRYQIWGVAVALTGVCVRDGKAGMRDGLGECEFFFTFPPPPFFFRFSFDQGGGGEGKGPTNSCAGR